MLLTAGSAILLKAGKCMSPRAFLGTHPTDEPISSGLLVTGSQRAQTEFDPTERVPSL